MKYQFKNYDKILICLCSIIILSLSCHELEYPCDYFDQSVYYRDDFHYIKGVWSLGGEEGRREYKFRNMPPLYGLVTQFPADSILAEVSRRPEKDIEVDYWIFTDVMEAELYMCQGAPKTGHLRAH